MCPRVDSLRCSFKARWSVQPRKDRRGSPNSRRSCLQRRPVPAARARAYRRDALAGLARDPLTLPGFRDDPGHHEQLRQLLERGIAWPFHDVETVGFGERFIFFRCVPSEAVVVDSRQDQVPFTVADREVIQVYQHGLAMPVPQCVSDCRVPVNYAGGKRPVQLLIAVLNLRELAREYGPVPGSKPCAGADPLCGFGEWRDLGQAQVIRRCQFVELHEQAGYLGSTGPPGACWRYPFPTWDRVAAGDHRLAEMEGADSRIMF